MKCPIKIYFDHNIKYLIINIFSKIIVKTIFSKIKEHSLTFIISIICFLIRKKYFRNTNKNITVFNTNKQYNYEELISNSKEYFNIILIYVLLLIIDILSELFKFPFHSFYYIFKLIGLILISYLKNEKIHKHQKISYIILFILFGYISSFTFFYVKTKTFIILSIISILWFYTEGLLSGYIKYSMEIKFIDPYFITIVDLGYTLLLKFLIVGINYFWKKKNRELYNFKLNLNYISFYIKYCIISLFIFIYYLFDVLVCYYYSPYHQCVCDIFTYFFIESKENWIYYYRFPKYIYTIFYIINIFFVCVVAEIIILNFCDLEKDTKSEIQKRAIIMNESLLESNEGNSIEIFNKNNQ